MKTLLTFISLIFFLFIGGQFCGASNIITKKIVEKSNTISENKTRSFTNNDFSILLVEDIDVDNEEDFSNTKDDQNTENKNLFSQNTTWTFFQPRISFKVKYNTKFANHPLFYGFSCPIYISQQVFRI